MFVFAGLCRSFVFNAFVFFGTLCLDFGVYGTNQIVKGAYRNSSKDNCASLKTFISCCISFFASMRIINNFSFPERRTSAKCII